MNGMRNLVITCLLLAVCAVRSWGQCSPGDILWVVETVNANVGTATGGGGTGSQCAGRTVAGAAYNSVVSPFGIQGAMDCACPGAEIRILAGANEYDSTTASWTNRLTGNEIQISTAGNTSTANGGVGIVGYADASTRCESLQTAGCPVEMDFTGGGGDGIDNAVTSFGTYLIGLHFKNTTAANRLCASMDGIQGLSMLSVEVSGCQSGLVTSSVANAGLFIYAHDNIQTSSGYGMSTAIGGRYLFTEAHDNAANGIGGAGGLSDNSYERTLSYDNTSNNINSDTNTFQLLYSTMARATGSGASSNGWFAGAGSAQNNGGWGLISTGNYGTGMLSYGDANLMTMWQCFVAGGNTIGSITSPNPPGPTITGVRDTADTTTVPTFASADNFSVSGVAACTYTWPGTTTTMLSCPGASPDCQGGGLFIQPVRVLR